MSEEAVLALAPGVLRNETRAVARLLRAVDDRVPGYSAALKALFAHTGRAYIVGITGNPGAGKSTLTDRLVMRFRAEGKRVAVLAVDPSSPYSGGAILGDRIRMNRHALDAGVFIRSVATRGHMGGLSRSARDMVRVLDASGADVVLFETVGVGQDEIEITRTAHTTLVVMAPGMGDEVQAIKAGIMESADVFAVNKADRDGVDSTVRDIELMIALGSETMTAVSKSRGHVVHGKALGPPGAPAHERGGASATWTPPITRCVSLRGEGIDELTAHLVAHRAWLEGTVAGQERKAARLAEEVRESLREALIDAATRTLRDELDAAVARVSSKTSDPYTETERLLEAFRGRGAPAPGS
ncbi:MAG: methylmalonyl Co-A mutase-associated GTPase MeaB [Myxococcales bacterium]|nr:methylmalonyl Co-A mutase-associated GTPase MeaB [Myxococcales bacterium]